jgi:hypothetical protein
VIIFSSNLAVIIAASFIRFQRSAQEKPTVDEASDLKSTSLSIFFQSV